MADSVRALRDPRVARDAAFAARRDVEMLTAALGEDEAADIAARVMMEEESVDIVSHFDKDDDAGGSRVEIIDAEEAYEHERAVLRAELEEIQALVTGDAVIPAASPEEMAKYLEDLDRLKALLGDVPDGYGFSSYEHFPSRRCLPSVFVCARMGLQSARLDHPVSFGDVKCVPMKHTCE